MKKVTNNYSAEVIQILEIYSRTHYLYSAFKDVEDKELRQKYFHEMLGITSILREVFNLDCKEIDEYYYNWLKNLVEIK